MLICVTWWCMQCHQVTEFKAEPLTRRFRSNAFCGRWHNSCCKWMDGADNEMRWAGPARACESWPIRADWIWWKGDRKETGQRVNRGAAAIDSLWKIMCFSNIEACKHLLVDTQSKSINLKISVSLFFKYPPTFGFKLTFSRVAWSCWTEAWCLASDH